MKTYFIHDNGGRPFKVVIDNDKVYVYKNIHHDFDTYEDFYSDKPILTFHPMKIFIGKSPFNTMTQFSGGHGPEFDGNSILIQMSEKKYVYIGRKIYSFATEHKITKYVSPVGNSDVPYPYAVDNKKHIYLLEEDVIIKRVPRHIDPYDYFYDDKNYRIIDKQNNISFDGIQSVHKKESGRDHGSYLWYNPKEKDLGYNWIMNKTFKGNMWGKRENEKKTFKINKKMFMEIVQKFEKEKGYQQLKKTVLQKRLW